jgi:hypothetical protein
MAPFPLSKAARQGRRHAVPWERRFLSPAYDWRIDI